MNNRDSRPEYIPMRRATYFFAEKQRWSRLLELVSHLHRHNRMMRAVSGKEFKTIRKRQPKLTIKYLNPKHLVDGLTPAVRATALIHHYDFLRKGFGSTLLRSIFDKGMVLWQADSTRGLLALTLKFSHPTDNEGELSIEFSVAGDLLYILSFTFVPGDLCHEGHNTVLLISRIQGMRDRFQDIRETMKLLNGLAAPSLLLAATQGIAEGLALRHIIGISAERQVCRSEHHQALSAAYDEFFCANGATFVDGFYVMSLPLVERPITAIKSSNRGRVRAQRELKKLVASSTRQRLALTPFSGDAANSLPRPVSHRPGEAGLPIGFSPEPDAAA